MSNFLLLMQRKFIYPILYQDEIDKKSVLKDMDRTDKRLINLKLKTFRLSQAKIKDCNADDTAESWIKKYLEKAV